MTLDATASHEHYGVQWLIVGVILLGVVWIWSPWRQPTSWPHPPHLAPGEGVEWFLMIRIPEVPNDDGETEAAKAQVTSWLEGLQEAGFQPMLLSTVLSRLERGLAFPKKTVVILFYSGYRHTYETLAPILEQRQCPAVWLTDWRALQQADRRYLSHHTLNQLKRSGHWDVAWYRFPPDPQTDRLAFELAGSGAWGGTPRRLVLDLRMAQTALNQISDGHVLLTHLPARPPWSAQELVDRLLAEVPIDSAAHLTARHVGPRIWGLAADAHASADRQPFALAVPMDARATTLSWACTSGHNDVVLDVNLLSRFGDLWVLLRSNPSLGQGIRVGFTTEAILVEQDVDGVRRRLAESPWPSGVQNRLMATIILHDTHLAISVNDQPMLAVESLSPPADRHGVVELLLSDKVRGAAGIESASMVLVPLRSPVPLAKGGS
ncbi:MAG: hypothetical protein HYZ91_03830 [Candidatus Omnitrophica bacterium]|nr:hypothetical protein [Candidatus Omnitrophota bacterium]